MVTTSVWAARARSCIAPGLQVALTRLTYLEECVSWPHFRNPTPPPGLRGIRDCAADPNLVAGLCIDAFQGTCEADCVTCNQEQCRQDANGDGVYGEDEIEMDSSTGAREPMRFRGSTGTPARAARRRWATRTRSGAASGG